MVLPSARSAPPRPASPRPACELSPCSAALAWCSRRNCPSLADITAERLVNKQASHHRSSGWQGVQRSGKPGILSREYCFTWRKPGNLNKNFFSVLRKILFSLNFDYNFFHKRSEISNKMTISSKNFTGTFQIARKFEFLIWKCQGKEGSHINGKFEK